jgi:hypothetical protein
MTARPTCLTRPLSPPVAVCDIIFTSIRELTEYKKIGNQQARKWRWWNQQPFRLHLGTTAEIVPGRRNAMQTHCGEVLRGR